MTADLEDRPSLVDRQRSTADLVDAHERRKQVFATARNALVGRHRFNLEDCLTR